MRCRQPSSSPCSNTSALISNTGGYYVHLVGEIATVTHLRREKLYHPRVTMRLPDRRARRRPCMCESSFALIQRCSKITKDLHTQKRALILLLGVRRGPLARLTLFSSSFLLFFSNKTARIVHWETNSRGHICPHRGDTTGDDVLVDGMISSG